MALTYAEKLELVQILQEKQRRKCLASFYEFVKSSWHVIEPGLPFIDGWHLKAICDHLQAVHERKIRNLIINIPPRHAKSTIVSVAFPAWKWIHQPNYKFMYASHAFTLSKRDSIKCRILVTSQWYRETFKPQWVLSDDQNEKMKFNNTLSGSRRAASVGGSVIGEGSDCQVIDDPHNPMEVYSDTTRQNVLDWYDQEFCSRVNDPKTVSRVLIMQRLHEGDLTQHLLDKGNWEHLCLPAEYDGNNKSQTSLQWSDPRTELGEPLWPERFGKTELDTMKNDMGAVTASGQLQQNPTPAGGALFKPEMFEKVTLPNKFDWSFTVADTAYKEKQQNDFTCFVSFGMLASRLYVRGVWMTRIKASDVEKPAEAFIRGYMGYGYRATLIEPKGHGIYLNQVFSTKHLMIPSEKDLNEFYSDRHLNKVERANNAVPYLSNRKVYLNEEMPDVDTYIQQCLTFPNGRHDDFVDCLIDGVKRAYSHKPSILDLM